MWPTIHITQLLVVLLSSAFLRRVRKIAKSDSFLRNVRPSARQSVRPHGTTLLPLDGFSWNLMHEDFFENLSRKFKLHYNLARITVLYVKTCWFAFMISRPFLLRMRNVSDKSCRGQHNTHFVFSNFWHVYVLPLAWIF